MQSAELIEIPEFRFLEFYYIWIEPIGKNWTLGNDSILAVYIGNLRELNRRDRKEFSSSADLVFSNVLILIQDGKFSIWFQIE